MNDVQKMSNGKIVLLAQLDLGAAFDTIDHETLIQLLHEKFGFNDDALKFFNSFFVKSQFFCQNQEC